MLLFDLTEANITINYEYDDLNTNGTTEDTTDDFIERDERSFGLNLVTPGPIGNIFGNAVNQYTYENFPADIENAIA